MLGGSACPGPMSVQRPSRRAPGRIRTSDQELRRLLLCPLSYGGSTPACVASAVGQGVSAERVKGIEPSPPAWKAGALPLSYTRRSIPYYIGAGPVRTLVRHAVFPCVGSRLPRLSAGRSRGRSNAGGGRKSPDSGLGRYTLRLGGLAGRSGWSDSNRRPPAPKAGALPSCATARRAQSRRVLR